MIGSISSLRSLSIGWAPVDVSSRAGWKASGAGQGQHAGEYTSISGRALARLLRLNDLAVLRLMGCTGFRRTALERLKIEKPGVVVDYAPPAPLAHLYNLPPLFAATTAGGGIATGLPLEVQLQLDAGVLPNHVLQAFLEEDADGAHGGNGSDSDMEGWEN